MKKNEDQAYTRRLYAVVAAIVLDAALAGYVFVAFLNWQFTGSHQPQVRQHYLGYFWLSVSLMVLPWLACIVVFRRNKLTKHKRRVNRWMRP